MNTLIVEKQKYWEINSKDIVNFQIHFTNSILSQFKTIEDLSETNRVFLLVDENIWKIYKNQFEILIKNSTKKVHIKKIQPDEKNKNIDCCIDIIKFVVGAWVGSVRSFFFCLVCVGARLES